ncbi:DMT family transporter [Ramlibacter sp. G-1-2-2]|uniref:DMT family transporter n=1 Tax=Ramlibacter agri TaxID=2728837 RepID=A0A848GUU1_9BURK|nr:DMT family transporter [Ramlibacter agri]NML42385.1 DMT family transporter [Ramlibacter agri]
MAEKRGVSGPVLALVCNAFVWGVSWWPFRQLHEQGLHPLWSTALMYLLALACALAVRPAALAEFSRQPLLWLLAGAAGLTNVGFNWAVTVGDVVRVVLLFYLMPAWSVLLAWLLLGDKPTPAALARLLLALVGVVIVLHQPGNGFPWPREPADLLALMGGCSFALTNVMLRRLHAVPGEARLVAMFGGGAVMAVVVAALGLAQGLVLPVPALGPGSLVIGALLTVAFLGGNVALQYGAARLPAHTTALVMLSEVVFASLSSVALGAAQLSPGVLTGGALILAAAAWSAWPQRSARAV